MRNNNTTVSFDDDIGLDDDLDFEETELTIDREHLKVPAIAVSGDTRVYTRGLALDDALSSERLVIVRSWRSLPGHWFLVFTLAYLGFILSVDFPSTVLNARVPFFFTDFLISFPMFQLPLAIVILHAFWVMYNNYCDMDADNLRFYRGILSFNHEISEMESASMLVVKVIQRPWEAMLGVGSISIGRFSRKMMELELQGVAHPYRCVRIMKLRVKRARERASKFAAVAAKSKAN